MIKGRLTLIGMVAAVFLSICLASCDDQVSQETAQPVATSAVIIQTQEPVIVDTPEPESTTIPEDQEAEPDTTEEDEIEETQPQQPLGLSPVIVAGDFARVGNPFSFDATQSRVDAGSIAGYEWDMGDGTYLYGITIKHVYAEPGFYTVTLTITTDDGQTAAISKEVEVNDLQEEVLPTTESEFTLVGTSWLMNNAVRGTTVTMEFGEETLSGSSGCNSYEASYTTTPGEGLTTYISVGDISVTNLVCTLEVMGQEQGFLESLASAKSCTIDGILLIMETGSGTLTFSPYTQ